MPINETMIAVPTNVEQPGQTRMFLVRLVEKLDIVFGYRGDDPYVALSQLESATGQSASNLSKLEQTILDQITEFFNENNETLTSLITSAIGDTASSIEALKSSSAITNASESTQVISNPPTQAEVQAIQDQVVTNAERFNDLLTALRDTGIIAT